MLRKLHLIFMLLVSFYVILIVRTKTTEADIIMMKKSKEIILNKVFSYDMIFKSGKDLYNEFADEIEDYEDKLIRDMYVKSILRVY